jgi:hypothetical protein
MAPATAGEIEATRRSPPCRRSRWVLLLSAAACTAASAQVASRHGQHWCLPSSINISWEGVWHGLMLWGQLPVAGPLAGHAAIVQQADESRIYFRYRLPSGVTQEQWAAWRRGGRAVTVGKNTTADGRASSCVVVKDEPAADDSGNSPHFCSQTPQIDLHYVQDVHIGAGHALEEWVFSRGTRVPNATLKLLMEEVPAADPGDDRAGGATGWVAHSSGMRTMVPVWHRFGVAGEELPAQRNSYSVDHVMFDASPVVDMAVFDAMPAPESCTPSDHGHAGRSPGDDDADIRARAARQRQAPVAVGDIDAALGGGGSGGGGNARSGGCPFGFHHLPAAEWEVAGGRGRVGERSPAAETTVSVDAHGDQAFSTSSMMLWLRRLASDLPFGFDALDDAAAADEEGEPGSSGGSSSGSRGERTGADDGDDEDGGVDAYWERLAAEEAEAQERRLAHRWEKVRGGIESVVVRAARWWGH